MRWRSFAWMASIIRIHIANNIAIFSHVFVKHETNICSSLQITQNSFHCFPMLFSYIILVTTDNTNSMWKIKSSAYHNIHGAEIWYMGHAFNIFTKRSVDNLKWVARGVLTNLQFFILNHHKISQYNCADWETIYQLVDLFESPFQESS